MGERWGNLAILPLCKVKWFILKEQMEVFNGMTSWERSYIRTPNTPRKLIIYSFAKNIKNKFEKGIGFLGLPTSTFQFACLPKQIRHVPWSLTWKLWKWAPGKGGSFWKPWFSASMLIFGGCNHGILKRKLAIISSQLFLLRQGVELSALGAWLGKTDAAPCSEHLFSQGLSSLKKKDETAHKKWSPEIWLNLKHP